MKKIFLLSLSIFAFNWASADEIFQSKDWTAYKDITTVLGKKGCVAETVAKNLPDGKEDWVLQVVRLKNTDGDYSFNMILSYPKNQPSVVYYQALGYSNNMDPSDGFKMTLLQPGNGDQSIVAGRMNDRNPIVTRLKADSNFTLEYLSKDTAERSVEFSLKGSSRTINTLMETCR